MSEWQPIETAPKDQRLLLFFPTAGMVATGYWAIFDEAWQGEPFTEEDRPLPTHWMPLPELPEQEGNID